MMTKTFKVTLINPAPAKQVGQKQLKYHRRFPPLSFLTAAQMLLDRGFSVEVIDLQISEKWSLADAIESSRHAQLVVLATSAYADWQCPTLRIDHIFAQALLLPSEKLAISGNHGTQFPGAILEKTGATYVIREEEEWGLVSLATALRDGTPVETVPFISFKKEDVVHHNPSRTLPSMTELPVPAFQFMDPQDYNYELLGGNFALLEASRGCPFACNFCNRSMFQNKYRKDDIQKVAQSLEILVEQKNCRSLYFFDLEFTVNRKLVEDICHFIIEKDYPRKWEFKWCCQTRADSVDPELCALMKKAGCELIHFGVESGHPDILKSTNKKITIEKIRQGVAAAQQAGIQTAAFFIFGHPGESLAQRQQTLDFALSLNPTYASFHSLVPFPGSPLFEEKYGKGPYWETPYPSEWGYHSEDLEKKLQAFCKKALLKYYVRPQYLVKTLERRQFALLLQQGRLFLSHLRA